MSEQTNREKEVFSEALEMGSTETRWAYVRSACGPDHELRERVEALLKAYESAGGFIPTRFGRLEDIPTVTAPVPLTEGPGAVIGRYKLLQQIGEGGFGAVYMAEQKEPVKRRVALKIIKLGMDTKSVIARFEAERQALALMDHPNIAKVLDAGATSTGRPYFVMELVRGVRITQYCDENNLPPSRRLKLFMQVCRAIQHAHEKGIIHRDIKPSNILVTLHDGVPVPKVIDFGIAKATQRELTEKTLFTQFQQFIGTPAYMSPEQAEMSGLDIDTRSDIYALGVLLYELLTGKTPFDAKTLVASGLDEMRRKIREEEPLRPSTCLSTMAHGERTAVGKHRQSDPARLIHLFRGDLDWIVMKALEKDRTRRYETATGLATEIARHLKNEPVFARPPSAAYRLQKFVRRKKVQFAVAAIVASALIFTSVVSSWQAARVKRAEQTAKEQAEIARSAEEFIAEKLPHLYRVRLGEEPRTEAPPYEPTEASSFRQRIAAGDDTVTEVPDQVVRTYLALNRTNAESLLAAQRVGAGPSNLHRQAATNFPNHPEALFTAVTLDLFPQERRSWIERFKAAAPDNALPLYLSAWAYLKEADTERGLLELQAAVQEATLDDYSAERIQALEEIYLLEGRSPAEAKAVATSSLILPHLSLLKDLAGDLAALQAQYAAAGDTQSIGALGQLGVQLGRQLSSGSGADFLISQKIGLAIERRVLEGLDPQFAYDWLRDTPAERLKQIDNEHSAIEQARARMDHWLNQASDGDIVPFFDRMKLYSEAAVLRWLDQRSSESTPNP